MYGCVGGLGQIFVRLQRPSLSACEKPQGYWKRKRSFSLAVRNMSDADGRFVYMSARTAGSTHNATALGITNLARALENIQLHSGYWLAGDEAYPYSE